MNGPRVSFALLLYDEFDGSPIRDSGVVFRAGGRIVTPLRKREGFYVFCGLEPLLQLEILRPHFHRESVGICRAELDPAYPLVRVRLLRAGAGMFPGCRWLQADCPEGSEVLAYGEELARASAVEADEKGARLILTGFTTAVVTGKRLALDRNSGETFVATELLSPNAYRIDRVPKSFPRGGAAVHRAYLSRGDPGGVCCIPVEAGDGDLSQAIYRAKGEAQWVCVSAAALS